MKATNLIKFFSMAVDSV